MDLFYYDLFVPALSGFQRNISRLSTILQIFKENTSIHAFMINLILFGGYPLQLVVFLRFIFKRQEIWTFFADWRQAEDRITIPCQLSDLNVKKIKRLLLSVNLFICSSMLMIFYFMFNNLSFKSENSTFLFSSYKEIRDNLNLNVVAVFHATVYFMGFILFSLSDLVPGFIFYHIGLALQSLGGAIEQNFERLNQYNEHQQSVQFRMGIHEIFLRYESVRKLTKRANRLFGALMILNHVTFLFLITTFLYLTLFQIQRSHKALIFYFPGFLTFVYFLVTSHLLAAFLNSSSSQLISTLSSLLSRHSIHLSQHDYRVAFGFLNHFQQDQFPARPLLKFVFHYQFKSFDS